MKYLPILLLLWTLPARALVSDEINRACQKQPGVYRACLANLAHQYSVGYRAFDLFSWLSRPTFAIPLKIGAGHRVETGVALDLALDGPGYFLLSQQRGSRSAAFRFRSGRLCTLDGACLLGYPPGSSQLQALTIPEQAVRVQVDSRGLLSWTDRYGDGKPEEGGRVAVAQVEHEEWLLHQGQELKATPASGPFRASPGGRVLAGTLELSNATALEQQETYRALSAYAGITGSRAASHPARARRDLLTISQQHDQRCLVSLNNLRHQGEPGFRASDVLVRDLSGFRLRPTQGTLRETNDPYNLAIDGEGYFVLEGGLLTRSGEFQMSRNGQLVSHDGLALQGRDGPVDVPDDYSNVEIKGDGTIFGTPLNGDGRPLLVTQLQLAQVADPSWLERSGSHLRATAQSGVPRLYTPGQDGCGVVAQGYLENSNLSAIEQMKTLSALRNYAQLLKMPLSDDYQP